MTAIIKQYTLNKDNKFMWEASDDSPTIMSVTDISVKCSSYKGAGTKFYINDSPYPITIYDKSGLWQGDFNEQVDIYKVRICPPNDTGLKFYLSITGY